MNRRFLGSAGEWIALCVLLLRGYRLKSRNWRGGGGEIDLVMERRGEIVFVEVKTRSGDEFGGPVGAVDRRKTEILARAASAYLGSHGLWDRPCRFDVVGVRRKGSILRMKVEHIENAFSPDLGRRM